MPHDHVNIFRVARDACWIADVPDLKYCSPYNATVAEVAREIEIAMSLWLETAAENGAAIPQARYRPDPVHQAA